MMKDRIKEVITAEVNKFLSLVGREYVYKYLGPTVLSPDQNLNLNYYLSGTEFGNDHILTIIVMDENKEFASQLQIDEKSELISKLGIQNLIRDDLKLLDAYLNKNLRDLLND